MPRPSAQQLNPEGNVGESLLRLEANFMTQYFVSVAKI